MQTRWHKILDMTKSRSHEIGLVLGGTTIVTTMLVSLALLFQVGTAAKATDRLAYFNAGKYAKLTQLEQKAGELWATPGALASIVDMDMPDLLSLDKTYKSVDLFGRTFSQEEMCLAQAVYFEGRGEPLVGQVAIAEVVLNRIVDRRYPDTACKVVFQNQDMPNRCQFSFACDGLSDRPKETSSWETALKVVALVMNGERSGIAKRATHYHALYVSPKWSAHLSKLGQVGSHIFYREEVI